MNVVYKHIIRFVVFAFLQALVFNQLNIGFGIHLMIQPLFIMLLPFELTVIPMMGIAFLMGLVIDIFSNTYGLNTSALVLMAYLRPIVFKFYGPREGYDPLKWAPIGLLSFTAFYLVCTHFGSFYSKFSKLAVWALSCKKHC